MIPHATHKNNKRDYVRAKRLRQNSSLAEQKFWVELRGLQKLVGIRFRRQQPIHPYIVDFACMQLKLVIELDGRSHDATQKRDERRTQFLAKQGFKVVRYMNEDVMDNVEGVITALNMEITSLTAPTPPLSPPARGGERC